MGEVIGLTKPNSELIDLLEALLAEARAGTLTSIAAVILRNNETDFELEVPDFTSLELVGALETLKFEIMNA